MLFDVVYLRLIELENRWLNHPDRVFFMVVGTREVRYDAEAQNGDGIKAVSDFHETGSEAGALI